MSTQGTFQAQAAQAMHEEELLAKPNVVGVALGYKESNGVISDEVAVIVLVEQKKPLAALQPGEMIPREVNGTLTDVIEVGYLRAQQTAKERYRPIIPSGVSIGHFKVTAGTLGTLVKDRATGDALLLSNNHVFANSNDAAIGDVILQPAAMDGGQNPGDVVARLERYAKLLYLDDPAGVQRIISAPTTPPVVTPPVSPPPVTNPPITPPPGGTTGAGCDIVSVITGILNGVATLVGSEKRVVATTSQALDAENAVGAPRRGALGFDPGALTQQAAPPDNRLDAALARPIDAAIFSDDIRTIGIVNATAAPALNMRVRKYGRTTELTEGTVNLVNATINIAYNTSTGTRSARFVGQVIATGMSQGGDSGSLIVDAASNRAVGLLFAGSNVATVFTPIDIVLNTLNIDL